MERNIQKFRTPPNLVDHLEAFVTVLEEGGFSAAARVMGRGVSSISYSIAQLEKQCGFALLIRGTGQVELTERGRALYSEARAVVDDARRFTAHARLLETGEETRLRILVDVLFPRRFLNQALARFDARHPRTRLQFFNSSLNTLWEELRRGSFDLALTLSASIPSDMEVRALSDERLSPYCAATHRLARLPGPLPPEVFRGERQIFYVGAPELEVERIGRVFSTDVWTVDDVEQVRQLVIDGLGWCFGAAHTFEDEVRDGRVRELACLDPKFHPVRTVGVVWPLERPPGILGRSLIETILG